MGKLDRDYFSAAWNGIKHAWGGAILLLILMSLYCLYCNALMKLAPLQPSALDSFESVFEIYVITICPPIGLFCLSLFHGWSGMLLGMTAFALAVSFFYSQTHRFILGLLVTACMSPLVYIIYFDGLDGRISVLDSIAYFVLSLFPPAGLYIGVRVHRYLAVKKLDEIADRKEWQRLLHPGQTREE